MESICRFLSFIGNHFGNADHFTLALSIENGIIYDIKKLDDYRLNPKFKEALLETTPLVILDTNVLIAGLCRREESPSFKILCHIQKGIIPLALTQKLYLEYEAVLTRKAILNLINADKKEVLMVLEALLALSYKSEIYYLWRPNLTDESDNFVLEAAIATSAVIITKNTADFQTGELQFPDLAVLRPQQFCDLYL